MTLVELLDSAMNECGFRARGNYAGSTSQDDRQMLVIANRAVSFLLRQPWMLLRRRYELTLTADETYDLPADFHGLIPETTRANARVLPVEVQTDPGMWSWLKTRSSTGSAQYRTRWWGNTLQIHNPSPGDVVEFEYWSSEPITDAGGTPKPKFTADSDTWDLDDDLLLQQIVWRFKKAKGLQDWQMDQMDAASYMREFMGRQNPSRIVDVCGPHDFLTGEPYTDLWLD